MKYIKNTNERIIQSISTKVHQSSSNRSSLLLHFYSNSATVKGMKSILLIEDDETIAKAYTTVLSQEGYEVFTASTGPQAMTLLNKQKIQLILLDIMLPGGMNGFDILMRIKLSDQTKTIPVIVMSNLDTEKKTALDYGATEYFIKAETNTAQLVNIIKHHLPVDSS